MDDIIQKIIDLEKKAQDVVGEAREERQAYEETMQSELDAYRERIIGENRAKIEGVSSRIKKEADESVKFIEDAAKLKIVQMQRDAASRRREWVEQLYDQIVGGDIE